MGYFIVDQLPEREKKDARKHLWVGKFKDCERAGAKYDMGVYQLTIVNHADKAVGYHEPLTIHLCGPWRDYPYLCDIVYYFQRLSKLADHDIVFITE